jgi:hypothetical protein
VVIQCASKRYWRWEHLAPVLVILACGALQAHGRTAAADAPANAATERIQQETRRILSSIKETVYKHRTDIDEETGIYRCDCSGFGGYILSRTVAEDDPKNPLGDGRSRPRAVDFHDAFAKAPTEEIASNRWQRIERLIDARPGDIIAWRREKLVPGDVTGHVIIVDRKPVQEMDGRVRVVMIDSTTRPQVNDTRGKGDTGIGRGTMWFTVDDDGRPMGYIRGSRTAEPKIEPIAIGRALERRADQIPRRKSE